MISVNDFAPGDQVHLLSERKSSKTAPAIYDATVRRIRNGYVWISVDESGAYQTERTFCRRKSTDSFLTEDDQFGWGDRLFRSQEDAEKILQQETGRRKSLRFPFSAFSQ